MIYFETISSLPKELASKDLARLGRLLGALLRIRKARTVGVRFVSKAQMQVLNKQHRGINKPTDVLSFGMSDVEHWPSLRGSETMGDLVLCPPYAAEEARRRHLPLKEELVRLLVHGVLHLAGYDHATEKEELKMFQKQEGLVERFFA